MTNSLINYHELVRINILHVSTTTSRRNKSLEKQGLSGKHFYEGTCSSLRCELYNITQLYYEVLVGAKLDCTNR